MKRRLGLLTALLFFDTVLLPLSAPAADQMAKPLSAQATLDRYVQVTGGLNLYRRYGFFVVYSTVTRDDGSTFNTALYHSRDGATHTEIDAGDDSAESGVSNGIVWEYSEKKGAKILDGKAAKRQIAEWRGLDADDWGLRYPTAKAAGVQTINGKNCYHVKLTRTDESVVDQFYEVESGLLVRETSTDFNEFGAEEP